MRVQNNDGTSRSKKTVGEQTKSGKLFEWLSCARHKGTTFFSFFFVLCSFFLTFALKGNCGCQPQNDISIHFCYRSIEDDQCSRQARTVCHASRYSTHLRSRFRMGCHFNENIFMRFQLFSIFIKRMRIENLYYFE